MGQRASKSSKKGKSTVPKKTAKTEFLGALKKFGAFVFNWSGWHNHGDKDSEISFGHVMALYVIKEPSKPSSRDCRIVLVNWGQKFFTTDAKAREETRETRTPDVMALNQLLSAEEVWRRFSAIALNNANFNSNFAEYHLYGILIDGPPSDLIIEPNWGEKWFSGGVVSFKAKIM